MGGVAGYTSQLAQALADAGVAAHVWCPGGKFEADRAGAVHVHRIGQGFSPRPLLSLDRELDRFARPRTLLVQYTPHAFGYKSMNLPLAAWLASRAGRGDDVRIMFHEVAYPWVRRPLRHDVIAAVHRIMAALLVRSCSHAYVSIPAWMPLLRRLGAGRKTITWTPVPSNVPANPNPAVVGARRAELGGGPVVGHFGTYGREVTALLAPVLRTLLERRPDLRVLLLGVGGERWAEQFRAEQRVKATGPLQAVELAEYLCACDLMIQPYPDGISSRRTSAMAALANGVPVVTTLGVLSEQIGWSRAVAAVTETNADGLAECALELLRQPAQLKALGSAGYQLYQSRFALERTVAALLGETTERMIPV